MPHVLTSQCNHWLFPTTPLLNVLISLRWELSVCQSGISGVLPVVVGLQLCDIAIEQAQ